MVEVQPTELQGLVILINFVIVDLLLLLLRATGLGHLGHRLLGSLPPLLVAELLQAHLPLLLHQLPHLLELPLLHLLVLCRLLVDVLLLIRLVGDDVGLLHLAELVHKGLAFLGHHRSEFGGPIGWCLHLGWVWLLPQMLLLLLVVRLYLEGGLHLAHLLQRLCLLDDV